MEACSRLTVSRSRIKVDGVLVYERANSAPFFGTRVVSADIYISAVQSARKIRVPLLRGCTYKNREWRECLGRFFGWVFGDRETIDKKTIMMF